MEKSKATHLLRPASTGVLPGTEVPAPPQFKGDRRPYEHKRGASTCTGASCISIEESVRALSSLSNKAHPNEFKTLAAHAAPAKPGTRASGSTPKRVKLAPAQSVSVLPSRNGGNRGASSVGSYATAHTASASNRRNSRGGGRQETMGSITNTYEVSPPGGSLSSRTRFSVSSPISMKTLTATLSQRNFRGSAVAPSSTAGITSKKPNSSAAGKLRKRGVSNKAGTGSTMQQTATSKLSRAAEDTLSQSSHRDMMQHS